MDINPAQPKDPGEVTLSMAIDDLRSVSYKLKSQVFGDMLEKPNDATEATNKIIRLRENIYHTTDILRTVSKELELLGK